MRCKSQGSMEYLVIIAAVLIISATVVFLVTGAAGQQKEHIIINSCRQAAAQCQLQRAANPDAPCEFCEEQCTYDDGEPVFDGAVQCCQKGQQDMIYEGSPGCAECGDGVIQGDEECDGGNLNGTDCTDLGYTGGELTCSDDCTFDTSGCTGCTDDSVCTGDQICCGGLCQEPICTTDSNCPSDTICADYYCSNGGTCLASCEINPRNEGESCASEDRSCSGCTLEVTTYQCSGGMCDASVDTTSCSPYDCSGGLCVSSPCSSDSDCCGSRICNSGNCEFPLNEYTLTISSGNGGYTNPSEGDHSYEDGTVVDITATPHNAGWTFDYWSGGCSGTSPSCQVTMSNDKSVTAHFKSAPGTTDCELTGSASCGVIICAQDSDCEVSSSCGYDDCPTKNHATLTENCNAGYTGTCYCETTGAGCIDGDPCCQPDPTNVPLCTVSGSCEYQCDENYVWDSVTEECVYSSCGNDLCELGETCNDCPDCYCGYGETCTNCDGMYMCIPDGGSCPT